MTVPAEAGGAPADRERSPRAALLAVVERVLNREIAESTAARDLLADVAGKSFAIEVAGTSLVLRLTAVGERVTAATGAGPRATVTLRAAPLDLLRLLRADGLGDLKGTQAELTGELHTAEAFARLLKLARPDLEEQLARFVGDVAAHEIGSAARAASRWLGRAAAALRMNTTEYLQEESRALPTPLETQAFFRDVERLRDDVERAAARLARLERRP